MLIKITSHRTTTFILCSCCYIAIVTFCSSWKSLSWVKTEYPDLLLYFTLIRWYVASSLEIFTLCTLICFFSSLSFSLVNFYCYISKFHNFFFCNYLSCWFLLTDFHPHPTFQTFLSLPVFESCLDFLNIYKYIYINIDLQFLSWCVYVLLYINLLTWIPKEIKWVS